MYNTKEIKFFELYFFKKGPLNKINPLAIIIIKSLIFWAYFLKQKSILNSDFKKMTESPYEVLRLVRFWIFYILVA